MSIVKPDPFNFYDCNRRRKETDDQKSDCSINPCGRAIDSWVITGIEHNYRNPAPHRKGVRGIGVKSFIVTKRRFRSLSLTNSPVSQTTSPYPSQPRRCVTIFHMLIGPCTQQGDDLDQWWWGGGIRQLLSRMLKCVIW